MKIIKIFNNNIVSARNDKGEEIIVAGSGIGFKKKPNDLVEESKIEKTYIYQDKLNPRFESTLSDIPYVYFEITDLIISHAQSVLDTSFSSELFIAVSDHISFAVRRQQEGVILPNVMLQETRNLYPKEFEVGLWSLKLIEDKTGVSLDESEAGFIALHLANFSLKNSSNNSIRVIQFAKDIMTIIQNDMNIQMNIHSLCYSRLSTHLKYLAERIFRGEPTNMEDTTETIRLHLHDNKKLEVCINHIQEYIFNEYEYTLSPDEQTFLCIHIKNNTRQ